MVRGRHTGLIVSIALVGAVALFVRASRPAPSRKRRAERGSHHVVIVGAGFGGLQTAQGLMHVPGIRVTLLDEQNHHLFQPLLYQVATGALAPDEIASPVRAVVAGERRVEVLMARVTGVDTVRKQINCEDRVVPYDTLVLATGSQPSYFGHGSWRETALPLKTLDDALALRAKILTAFEEAADAENAAEQARALTFLLVGGGATGVEMAGSIAELAQEMLSHEFQSSPHLHARVLLVEAGPTLLAGFAADSIAHATEDLRRMGVEVRLNTRVTEIAPDHVVLGGETVSAGTVIWTAGVEATPVAEWLGLDAAKRGKVAVGPDLQVPGRPEIFVIGDAALMTGGSKPLPELAPVAKQQGSFVARSIKRRLRGRGRNTPFHYADYGQLAAIGRGNAIAEFGNLHLAGFTGWLTWAGAHIFFLIGFRNRFLVSAQWAFSYATKRRGGRVIISTAGSPSVE